MNFFRLIAVLAFTFSLPGCRNDAGPPAADTVLYNGAVYTMNDTAPRASAVAVHDGAIVFVGDNDTALRAYTVNAAHVMGLENTSGSIEVGKRADLIVIDRDLYELPPTDINAAHVQLTLVDGREVFRSADF